MLTIHKPTLPVALTPIFLALGLCPPPAPAADEGPALTLYSTADPAGFDPQQFIAQQRRGYDPMFAWQVPGFGVVKQTRKVNLQAGVNDLRFVDVAQFIDPTSVSFTDLQHPDDTAVLEQNFEFDLANATKVLDRYLDRDISVVLTTGDHTETLTGKLLSSAAGQLILQAPDGLRIIPGLGQQVKLGELPGGLITRPTLVWKIQTNTAGEHEVQTTYQTNGLTWRADYNLVLDAAETKADLGAWVTLMNLCGAGFKDARLKLIAGDVQRVAPTPQGYAMRGAGAELAMAAPKGFEEKAFFEYHLYTLPRRVDLPMNATQQIMLFPTARDVKVEKLLVYYGLPEAAHWGFFSQPQQDRNFGSQSNPKVDVYVRFKNDKASRLGVPLPRGKVRAYKRDDADGTLEFIGEDLIDHTARDERVLIRLGQSFDVVGERKQMDFTIDTSRRTMTERIAIEIRNHKDREQTVIIKENLYRWTSWEITQSSDPHEKIDSRTIHFEVKVPADGKKKVTYTVRYTW